MKLLIVLTLVYSAWAVSETLKDVNTEFSNFQKVHHITYKNDAEKAKRLEIFKTNYNTISAHNAANLSFTMGINQFADKTNAEYRQLNGFKHGLKVTQNKNVYNKTTTTLPASVDWTTKGYVTPIKDQGQCGSCWAFSTVCSIEGALYKATGKLVSLSEQNLVDCSSSYGNQACNGGLMDNAFKYVIANNGINTESSYGYVSGNSEAAGSCKYNASNIGAKITGYTDVKSGNEAALQNACATIGPISVAIDASHNSFQLYESGVYTESKCSSTQLDHGVTVVGYGTDASGKPYWIVKNSWGTTWGMSGYIKMSRNVKNQCGMATYASYPTGVNSV